MSPIVSANGDESAPQGCPMLHNEVNIKSMRELEEHIKEHETALVKLKRARNSLLSVSRLPPETLGDIFSRNVTRKGDFGGLEKRSHNFLFVCRYWFQVASCTLELWGFWGNTLRDWRRRCLLYPDAPLDLVLDGRVARNTLGNGLRNALRDRTARDALRRIHLNTEDSKLLRSIVSLLGVGCKEVRSCGVKSVVLLSNYGGAPANISDLFAYCSFPKLQRLQLRDCTISSWNLIAACTSVLTTLNLHFSHHPPTLTISQIISILGSNPLLQEVALSWCSVPEDGTTEPIPRVPLRNLRKLWLQNKQRHVFELLRHLDHPDYMDNLTIILQSCNIEDISNTVGPYLKDYLQRRGRSQGGLGLSLSNRYSLSLEIEDVGGVDLPAPESAPVNHFAEIVVQFDRAAQVPPQYIPEAVSFDLLAHIPREETVSFRAHCGHAPLKYLSALFPNLKALHLQYTDLHTAFQNSSLGGGRVIFPSLRRITLHWMRARDDDWSPLATFLGSRASSGNRLDTLIICGDCPMSMEVERNIKEVVRDFKRWPDTGCINPC